MSIDIETITEDDAIDLHHRLARRFGWAGTFFTRADAQERWEQEQDTPFTDEVWEAIRTNYYWRKAIEEQACSDGWLAIDEAIYEVSKAVTK